MPFLEGSFQMKLSFNLIFYRHFLHFVPNFLSGGRSVPLTHRLWRNGGFNRSRPFG